MSAPRRLFLSCLIGALLLPAVREAKAAGERTIVLLDVEGEKTPRLRKSLERMIKSQHKIIAGSVYREAARRLRAPKLTPNNVKKVCAYLQVDAILDGTVVAEDGRFKFIVRLRSGADGTIIKKIPMRINEPSLSEQMSALLEERLLRAIDDLSKHRDTTAEVDVAATGVDKNGRKPKGGKKPAKPSEEIEEEEEQPAAGSAKRPRSTEPDRKPEEVIEEEMAADPEEVAEEPEEGEDSRRVAASDTGEEEPGEKSVQRGGESSITETAEARTETEIEAPRGPTNVRTTPVLLHVGVNFVGRKLSFSHTGAVEEAPRGYDGTLVPSGYVVGEIYPMAAGGRRGPIANVGLGFLVDRVPKLNTSIEDGMGGTVELATRQWRYGVSLRYRHNFGSGPDGVSLSASVGYNTAGVSIAKDNIPAGAPPLDVPNVNYKYVDPGVGLRLPLVAPLAFLLEAKFLAPLDTGQIQTIEHYGAATVTGFDVDAGFEYRLNDHLLARAGARLFRMGYTFDGAGDLTDRNGDGMADVESASDRYLGGYLTGGYSF